MVRPEHAMAFEYMQKAFLRSRPILIEGGIDRGDEEHPGRALLPPGDVAPTARVPWSQVPATSDRPHLRDSGVGC
jgi:hypothetical protein